MQIPLKIKKLEFSRFYLTGILTYAIKIVSG